jgi:hypothetical protein
MYKRRRLVAILTLIVLVVSLFASALPVFAHEGEEPVPADGATPTAPISFHPVEPGVADGVRVYVRTNAVNPTEYLQVRQAIVDAGFPDVLEVSPGSLLVDLGDVAGNAEAEAVNRLRAVEMVTEIAPAPSYEAVSGKVSVRYPSWPFAAAAALVALLVGLFLARRLETTRTPSGGEVLSD